MAPRLGCTYQDVCDTQTSGLVRRLLETAVKSSLKESISSLDPFAERPSIVYVPPNAGENIQLFALHIDLQKTDLRYPIRVTDRRDRLVWITPHGR